MNPRSKIGADLARGRGLPVSCTLDDVSLDVELPPSWEGYLALLTPKQRREVGRKLRRLHEAGETGFDTVRDPAGVPAAMDVLLRLLRDSRADKAEFMTAKMETFFRAAAQAMAEAGRSYREILAYYYPGTEVVTLESN